MMSSREAIHQAFEDLKEPYFVPDVNLDCAKVVFILESPHTEELKHRVPVAGASGKMMSKILFHNQTVWPLGRIMIEGAKDSTVVLHEHVREIGLMNVSNIPLQASAYPTGIQQQYEPFIRALEQVRIMFSRKYRLQELNWLREILYADFEERLRQLQGKEVTIIPCGKFAEFYFELANLESGWNVLKGVPHPSRNQWYQETDSIKRLKLLFPVPQEV